MRRTRTSQEVYCKTCDSWITKISIETARELTATVAISSLAFLLSNFPRPRRIDPALDVDDSRFTVVLQRTELFFVGASQQPLA